MSLLALMLLLPLYKRRRSMVVCPGRFHNTTLLLNLSEKLRPSPRMLSWDLAKQVFACGLAAGIFAAYLVLLHIPILLPSTFDLKVTQQIINILVAFVAAFVAAVVSECRR